MESTPRTEGQACAGLLIINADDWGRDRETTKQIHDCVQRGTISSVSAMVFMEDSEKAAELAQERGVDAGLHLNFTTPFSAPECPASLARHQQNLVNYLLRHRFAQILFHPGLVPSFEYAVASQIDEFRRLYGVEPQRLDGHHHMHLCSNVLLGKLLPPETVVRRSFSFQPGEKSLGNRLYRKAVDRMLARRHRLVDFLFSLTPLEPVDRLRGISSLACQHVVELETHPVNPEEYRFLNGDEIFRCLAETPIASSFVPAQLGARERKPMSEHPAEAAPAGIRVRTQNQKAIEQTAAGPVTGRNRNPCRKQP